MHLFWDWYPSHIHARTHTRTHAYTQTHYQKHNNIYILLTHTYINKCTHTHTHTHVYIYININICPHKTPTRLTSPDVINWLNKPWRKLNVMPWNEIFFFLGRLEGSLFNSYPFPLIAPLTFDPYLICWVLSKEASSAIFFGVFGITRPWIETRSPGPLENTVPTSKINP